MICITAANWRTPCGCTDLKDRRSKRLEKIERETYHRQTVILVAATDDRLEMIATRSESRVRRTIMQTEASPLAILFSNWADYQQQLIKAIAPLTPEQLALRAAPNLRSV